MANSFIPPTIFGGAGLWQQDPAAYARWLSDQAQAAGGTWLGQQQQSANDEARRRIREIEDRGYQLQVQAATRQRDIDAAQIGNYKATQKYNEELSRIAGEKLKLEQTRQEADLTGMYNGAPTFEREKWQESAGMNRLNMAAQLRGPEDWLGYKQLTAGVNAGSPLTPGIGNWQAGGQTGTAGFAPGQNPTPITLQKLQADMGVGGSGPMGTGQAGTSLNLNPAEQQLAGVADQFSRNPHLAAGNWLEQLDPNTQLMLKGAAEKQGHSWADVMDRYKRSRWTGGEGSALAA